MSRSPDGGRIPVPLELRDSSGCEVTVLPRQGRRGANEVSMDQVGQVAGCPTSKRIRLGRQDTADLVSNGRHAAFYQVPLLLANSMASRGS